MRTSLLLFCVSLCLAAPEFKPGPEVEVPGTWERLDRLTLEFGRHRTRVEPMLAELQALQARYERDFDAPEFLARRQELRRDLQQAVSEMDAVLWQYRRTVASTQYKMLVAEAPKVFRKGVTEGMGLTSMKIFAYEEAFGTMNKFTTRMAESFQADDALFAQLAARGAATKTRRLAVSLIAVLAAAAIAALMFWRRRRIGGHGL